jgi:hypothetical protein
MISASAEDVSTIVSIMPIRLSEDKPLIPTHYEIPAVKDTESDVATLIVRRGSFKVYIDETRPALIIPEPADIVAAAICRDFKVSSSHFEPETAEPGLFWIRGGYTNEEVLEVKETKAPLAKARRLQNEWFKRLVATADDDWARYKMRKMISDLQRLACKCLSIERPWDIDFEIGKAVRLINCKFCRAEVHPEAIICMHCRGILDMARYKSEFVSIDAVKT